MDVIMKEGYGGDVGSGHPYPAQYRLFPMIFEPLVLMPDPLALSNPQRYRAHSYSGAISAGMFHTNAFVENNEQFTDWQMNVAVAAYSAEMTALLGSFSSRARYQPTTRPQVTTVAATCQASNVQTSLTAKVLTEAVPVRGVLPRMGSSTT